MLVTTGPQSSVGHSIKPFGPPQWHIGGEAAALLLTLCPSHETSMPTETEAWVVHKAAGPFELEHVTLDDPLEDEVLVE